MTALQRVCLTKLPMLGSGRQVGNLDAKAVDLALDPGEYRGRGGGDGEVNTVPNTFCSRDNP
jgi:hypothetical protein